MGDYLPEIDQEMHRKRVKMMQEREEMGDFGPESGQNVRILSKEEVIPAKLDALREYRELLEAKLANSSSSPLQSILDDVNDEIRELENGRE